MVYCRGCAKELHETALICPHCGAPQGIQVNSLYGQMGDWMRPSASSRRILPAFLLCFFFGVFGIHRFYAGKWGTGLVQLFTLGGLFIWSFVDLILIICGLFRDDDGNLIDSWT